MSGADFLFTNPEWVSQIQTLCAIAFFTIFFAQALIFNEMSYRDTSKSISPKFTSSQTDNSANVIVFPTSTSRPKRTASSSSISPTLSPVHKPAPGQSFLPSDILYNPNGKYGFGMCAGKHHDWLAWSQIRYLQHFFPNRQIEFLICHVGGELHADQISRLTSLPSTRVLDLANDQPEVTGFARGYPCKPLCMLQMTQEIIAMGDVDAVYFIDPFDSVETPTFEETGSMFLHDYRIMRHKSKYNYVVERFKHVAFGVNPCWMGTGIDRDNHLDHIGESSLVLFDRARHRKTLRELTKLHSNVTKVEYMYHVFWGDKETYWLAAAIANATCGWSLWRNAVLGNEFEREGISGICEKDKTYVQYQPFVKESPKISHVNGKAVKAYLNGEDVDWACCVSSPVLYSNDVPVPSTKGCRIWQNPPMEKIPDNFLEKIEWRRDIITEIT